MNGSLWKALGVLFGVLVSVIVTLTFNKAIDNSESLASVNATVTQIEKHLDEVLRLQDRVSELEKDVAVMEEKIK